ncbi:glycerophosphodiester phosphodiesterase [Georgenia yuyongxinii]|uniref:Glycerophosphodiester phosphodiesterase n=1 Tax=Georgenia yuyongxinii TaxID=2589797 RepID=A0A552WJH4_9MICO|nr:glycerophosphodiester phosphodiesterase [Georgenia yuyongxinii]TRW42908.1 glycerophosphodiester phosphodiesterase [Georgenia yuyongxinii]
MSNAIIKQQGPGAVVADNIWHLKLGAAPFALGLLAGVVGTVLAHRSAAQASGARSARAPTPSGWPVNFAHRGGRKIVPENTVEGFHEALAGREAVLELDAHTTADGVVVVIHDDTVDRTTDGTGPVARKTFAELQRLDAGYRFTPDGGATFPWRGRGVTVATLEAFYREFPDRNINIELKPTRPGTEEAVWRVIETAGGQARTLVVTDNGASIKRFRDSAGGSVATAAAVAEFVQFWLLSKVRLAHLYRAPFQALQPPDAYKGFRIVTPGLIRQAHAAGLRVDVWTIDDEDDMRRLLAWGVDGIMTDRPDVLARVLEEA